MPRNYGLTPPEIKPSVKSAPKKFVDRSDWPRQYAIHKERAERSGIVVLLASDVGRMVEGGRIVGLYSRITHDSKHFITYGSDDVLACVPGNSMAETVIFALASIHVASRTDCSSPNEADVEISSKSMEGGDWAIHLPAKDSLNIKKA